MKRIVVDIITGKIGRVVERYSPNYNPFYANHRVLLNDGTYRIVMEKHMREPMIGEIRTFIRELDNN